MNPRGNLKLASSSDELRFGPRGELRETFGTGGRVHIDRWLPFLVLSRSESGESGLARAVAINSPAYLLWPPEDDVEAEAALQLVVERLQRELGPILLVEVVDAPTEWKREDSPELPSCEISVAVSDEAPARVAAEALSQSLSRLELESHRPIVRSDVLPDPALESASAQRLLVKIPQIHRGADGKLYPQLAHTLVAQLIDSILCAAAAFMGEASGAKPAHFRSLGRSAFLAAALNADKKLDSIAGSYDFLLSISPINTAEARQQFIAGGEQALPDFKYRPLAVDPDTVKRDLYAVDLSVLEDLLLERLLSEKRREIDMQLTMLATRNTPSFRPASMLLYGAVTEDLLEGAKTILGKVRPKANSTEICDSAQVAAAARDLVAHYRSTDARFDARIEVRDDVAGLLVSGDKLMIAADSAVARNRLDPLLSHEVSVHLLTYFNGATQGLTIFRTGLAHYEGIQEGLGVFAEWAVGGLTPARLRLLAGRVIAVDAMLHGATFVEVYRMLRNDFGFGRNSAFDISARVFRSGGLAKDAIYLKGFLAVVDRVATGASLDAFWLGKIAPEHVDAVEELLQRGLLHPPVFVPEFLTRDTVRNRIATLRGDASLDRLLELE